MSSEPGLLDLNVSHQGPAELLVWIGRAQLRSCRAGWVAEERCHLRPFTPHTLPLSTRPDTLA